MSKKQDDEFLLHYASGYSASDWDYNDAIKDAAEHRKKMDADKKSAAERAKEEQERQEMLERQRIEREKRAAEHRRKAEERQRKREEEARLEAQRKAAEEREAARLAEEARRAAEEARIKAEKEFNSPKTIGDVTVPSPTDQDKLWFAENLERPHISAYQCDNMQITTLWQFHKVLEDERTRPKLLARLFFLAAQDSELEKYKLLKHHKYDIAHDYNAALRLAFKDNDHKAFDKLLEWGAKCENALRAPELSDFDKIKMAQFAGVVQYHWEKQDDQTILRRHYETDEETILTIRTTFNFKSKKIKTTTLIDNNQLDTCFERFDDQPTDVELMEAFDKLKALNGKPTPIAEMKTSTLKGLGISALPRGFNPND